MKFEPELAFWIFAGGGAGAVLRYAVICGFAKLSPGIPLPTLIANVVGCLLIGLLGYKWMEDDPAAMRWRAAVIVGVLGGFTTFSSFAFESYRLFADEASLFRGLANIAAHNVLGLLAVVIGVAVARQF